MFCQNGEHFRAYEEGSTCTTMSPTIIINTVNYREQTKTRYTSYRMVHRVIWKYFSRSFYFLYFTRLPLVKYDGNKKKSKNISHIALCTMR